VSLNLLDKGNPRFLIAVGRIAKERPDVLPLIETALSYLRHCEFDDLDPRILINPRRVGGRYYFAIGKDFLVSFKRSKSDDKRYAFVLELLTVGPVALDG